LGRVSGILFAPDFGSATADLRHSWRSFRLLLGTLAPVLRHRIRAMTPGRLVQSLRAFQQASRAPVGRASPVIPAVRVNWLTGGLVLLTVIAVIYGLFAILAGIAGLLVGDARAADVGDDARSLLLSFDPGTRELLHFLHTGSSSGLGAMFRVFNGVMLFLVCVLILYRVGVGVLETARTGRAAITGWQVLLATLAIGLTAPLPASGLGGAQHILLRLTDVSGALGTAVWRNFAVTAITGDRLGVSGTVRLPPGFRTMLGSVLVSETCAYTANRVAARAGDDPYIRINANHGSRAIRFSYDGTRWFIPNGLCGTITIRRQKADADAATGRAGEAHHAALLAVIGDLREAAADLGQRFIPGTEGYGQPLPSATAWLAERGIEQRYRDHLTRGLASAASTRHSSLVRTVEDAARTQGWIGAGGFFNAIALHDTLFHEAAADLPVTKAPSRAINLHVPVAAGAVTAISNWLEGADLVPGDPDGTGHPGLRVSDPDGGMIGELMTSTFGDGRFLSDNTDPFGDLISLGNWLIAGVLTMIATLSATAIASNTTDAVPIIGDALNVFPAIWSVAGPPLMLVLLMLIVVGITLAYLLPLIPFIRFLFGIITWLVALAEALIAMPLFMAAHLAADGADGRGSLTPAATRYGYALVLQAILRPPLMIFGLILGYLIFVAGAGLLSTLLGPHTDAVFSRSGNWFAPLVYLVLHAMIAYAIANAAFKTIDIIPARVVGWIGVHTAGADGDGAADSQRSLGAGVGRIEGLRPGRLPAPKLPGPGPRQ